MSADLSELSNTKLSTNMTRSSGFLSFSHPDPRGMSTVELEEEYQQLREENHQLQLRILGVNELARLLQDKNEQLQLVEDKNKRLEVAVVRLENRCANIEKMSKTQKGGGPASLSSKTGQSPFIPGPSRQILEGLMKENSELKKTLNSLTKKGGSGYLEAVKITQLEEVINCQKDELQFMRDQIKQLTDGEANADDNSGGLSLPANVSETGPLKRQLIKLQHATKVKDRFCALLSQQIAELQGKLTFVQQQNSSAVDGSKSEEGVTSTGEQLEKSTSQAEQTDASTDIETRYQSLLNEKSSEMEELRNRHASTLEKLDRIEKELKQKTREADDVEKLRDQLDLYIHEKSELQQTLEIAQKDLEMFIGRDAGTRAEDDISLEAYKKIERERDNLRKVVEDQTKQHSEEVKSYEADLLVLKTRVENEEYQRAIANSGMEHQINQLGQEKTEMKREISEKDDRIAELLDEIDAHRSEISDLKMELQQNKFDLQKSKTLNLQASRGSTHAAVPSSISGIYLPAEPGSLVYPTSRAAMAMVRDGITPTGDARNPTQQLHCDRPIVHHDHRTMVLSRDATKRPTQLPPNQPHPQYNIPGRVSPNPKYFSQPGYNTPGTQPRQLPTGSPRTLDPSYRSPGMPSRQTSLISPATMVSPVPGQPSSPFRSQTGPISPTYNRPGGYQMGQGEHPLTTSSTMYFQSGVMFSQPGPRRVPPPHAYQRPDDETSIPGGQRSPSPNPQGPQFH